MVLVAKQYRCTHSASCICIDGHLSEDALFLVFQYMNWNPRSIAVLSCACRWFDEIARRVLWKEFCLARAPRMMLDLHSGGSHNVDGSWKALGKLLIYCSGCTEGGLFDDSSTPGHFARRTRFSRTSGKSFLPRRCRTDVLYVSDPCEHLDQGEDGDLGLFRGIFKSFAVSRVKKMLIDKQAKFHPAEVCPYCKARLWSMLEAEMIPRSASYRLGAYDGSVECYVCLNGHLLGVCTLLALSDSSEGASESEGMNGGGQPAGSESAIQEEQSPMWLPNGPSSPPKKQPQTPKPDKLRKRKDMPPRRSEDRERGCELTLLPERRRGEQEGTLARSLLSSPLGAALPPYFTKEGLHSRSLRGRFCESSSSFLCSLGSN